MRPLLIISDAPTSETGLGRITRDLSMRIAKHMPDHFRVATAGYGGPYSSKLGVHQYAIDMGEWLIFNLPDIWKDFAGSEKGTVLWIWDLSRALWFARPENCSDKDVQKFLNSKPFKTIAYPPMDAMGPHGRLTAILRHTAEGFDQVLAYSQWAENILRNTLTSSPILDKLTNLPHGIDSSVFYPRDHMTARHGFGQRIGARIPNTNKFINVPDDALALGIVATNQIRKDWGLAVATVADLAKDHNIFLWCHTDVLERNWSIPALLNDFGLLKQTVITSLPLTDEVMAWSYSAMNCTLGVGIAEGFGFPIFESMACGTPCIHCDDGGAAEHLPAELKVNAEMYRLEGPYNCYRGVHVPSEWANRVRAVAKTRVSLPPQLDWNNLWPRWQAWLMESIL